MSNLRDLLNKQMNRREFLFQLGALFLFVSGITGILNKFRDIPTINRTTSSRTFGNGPYGGSKSS